MKVVIFLLALILLAIVAGPFGIVAGLVGGVAWLVIQGVTGALHSVVGPLAAKGNAAMNRAVPDHLPGYVPPVETGDRVARQPDGWWAIVEGEGFGPWSDRVIAENVMKVEQRRRGKAVP